MNAKLAAIALAVAAAGLAIAPSAALAGCVTKHGKGWAWTEDLAPLPGVGDRRPAVRQLAHPDGYVPQRAL